MKTYLIKVDGQVYKGLFTHGIDAAIDAMDRFPEATRISVRVCP